MVLEKQCCERCSIFLRDYLEATIPNKFFKRYLNEFTDLILDFTRYVPRSALYGAKARANLYMKSTNILYYSFLLKVIKGNTAHTRFDKEFAYLRLWLLEKGFHKSENRKDPYQNIDNYLDTHFIRCLDTLYEIHEEHSNPKAHLHLPAVLIEIIEEDDWSEYTCISPK